MGIFGRNGCGKSTLFKLILGVLKADQLNLHIDQKSLSPSEVIPSQKIAYLPQEPFLPQEMKVRNVIPLFFEHSEDQDKIFYSEGVGSFDHQKIGKLPAGQRKYLELLLLAHLDHSFLFLDEPFSMVEPYYIEKIKELLFSLKNKKGIVLTDHYHKDVLEITDHNFLIRQGKKLDVEVEQDLVTYGYLNKT